MHIFALGWIDDASEMWKRRKRKKKQVVVRLFMRWRP